MMYLAYLIGGGTCALIGAYVGYCIGVWLAYEGMRALAVHANRQREENAC